MISRYVGMRTPEHGQAFMYDLAGRLTERVQLTSDGWAVYKKIVLNAFGQHVDSLNWSKNTATIQGGRNGTVPPFHRD